MWQKMSKWYGLSTAETTSFYSLRHSPGNFEKEGQGLQSASGEKPKEYPSNPKDSELLRGYTDSGPKALRDPFPRGVSITPPNGAPSLKSIRFGPSNESEPFWEKDDRWRQIYHICGLWHGWPTDSGLEEIRRCIEHTFPLWSGDQSQWGSIWPRW